MASSDDSGNMHLGSLKMGELQGDLDEDSELFKRDSLSGMINDDERPV